MKRIVLLLLMLVLTRNHASAAVIQTERVGLRLIIVGTDTEAAALLNRLQAGEKFEVLAQSNSIDPSARVGGYIGAIFRDQLRQEFRAALEGLRPGQVSPIARIGRQSALLQLLTEAETQAIELKAWMDAGADARSKTAGGLWAMAIEGNSHDMVKALLDGGADVNAGFDDGSTVLMGAAQSGETEIVRTLLAAGASVNALAVDGTTALLLAARTGRTEIVRALLGRGAEVNARAASGLPALTDAAFAGHLDVVRALIEAGADVNAAMADGSTALMATSGGGHAEITQVLLRAGARVNAKSNGGLTALTEAAFAGHLEAVKVLVAGGGDVNASSANGLTVLMSAALSGNADVVRTLLDAGAQVNARDSKGWTALTHARASASFAAVQALLARADVSPTERSIAMGGAYVNEYYSSNEARLLELAAAEFQKVLQANARNAEALEWMGAVELLRWNDAPGLQQFRTANALLTTAAALSPSDPDRHYWIAAANWKFASQGNGASEAELGAIVDEGIDHAKTAIQLDPQFADAMDYLGALYRRKSEMAANSADRDQLLGMADAAHVNAIKVRTDRGNRPSRFSDQFSRPALPAPPKIQ